MAFDDWLRQQLANAGNVGAGPVQRPSIPENTDAQALLMRFLSGQSGMSQPAPRPIPAPLTPAQYTGGGGGVVANDILGQLGQVVLGPQYAGRLPAGSTARVAPPAVPAATQQQAMGLIAMGQRPADNGPSILDDPMFKLSIEAGNDPVTAMEMALQNQQRRIQEEQEAAERAGVERAATDPTAVGSATVEAVADPFLQAAMGAPGVARDLATDPIGTVKSGTMKWLDLMGEPQHQLALQQAELAYRSATGDKRARIGSALAGANPFQPLIELAGLSMEDWAKDNPDAVKDAYENGYQIKTWVIGPGGQPQQVVLETVPPGKEAVLAAFYADIGFLSELGYQIITDPLNLVGGVGRVGAVAKTAEAASDAGRVARGAAAVTRGTGRVLEGVKVASELPETAVFRGIPGAARVGVRAIEATPGGYALSQATRQGYRYLSTPTERTINELRNLKSVSAMERSGRALIDMARGRTDDGTSALPGGEPLVPTGGDVPTPPTATGPVTPEIQRSIDLAVRAGDVFTVRGYKIVQTDAGFYVVDANNTPVSGQPQKTIALARAEVDALTTTPPTTPTEPAPVESAVSPPADVATVPDATVAGVEPVVPVEAQPVVPANFEPSEFTKVHKNYGLSGPENEGRVASEAWVNDNDYAVRRERLAKGDPRLEGTGKRPGWHWTANDRFGHPVGVFSSREEAQRALYDVELDDVRNMPDEFDLVDSAQSGDLQGTTDGVEGLLGQNVQAGASAPTTSPAVSGPQTIEERISEIDAKIADWQERGRIARQGAGDRYAPSAYEVRQTIDLLREQRSALEAQLPTDVVDEYIPDIVDPAGVAPPPIGSEPASSVSRDWDVTVTRRSHGKEDVVESYSTASPSNVNSLGMGVSNAIPGRYNWRGMTPEVDAEGNLIGLRMSARKGGDVYEAVARIRPESTQVPRPGQATSPEVPAEVTAPSSPQAIDLTPYKQRVPWIDRPSPHRPLGKIQELAQRPDVTEEQLFGFLDEYTAGVEGDGIIAGMRELDDDSKRLWGAKRLANRIDKTWYEVLDQTIERETFRRYFPNEPIPDYRYHYGDGPFIKHADTGEMVGKSLRDALPPVTAKIPRYDVETAEKMADWWRAVHMAVGSPNRGPSVTQLSDIRNPASNAWMGMIERALGPDEFDSANVLYALRQLGEEWNAANPAIDLSDMVGNVNYVNPLELHDELKIRRANMQDPSQFPIQTPESFLPEGMTGREAQRAARRAYADSINPGRDKRKRASMDRIDNMIRDGKRVSSVSDDVAKDGSSRWVGEITFDDGTVYPFVSPTQRDGRALLVRAREGFAPQQVDVPVVEPNVDVPSALRPVETETIDSAIPAEIEPAPGTLAPSPEDRARIWQGEPRAAQSPYRGLWQQARQAEAKEDARAIFDDWAEARYGPRDKAMRPSERVNRRGDPVAEGSLVYERSTAGRGWKRIDQEWAAFETNWNTFAERSRDATPSALPDDALEAARVDTGILEGVTAPEPALGPPRRVPSQTPPSDIPLAQGASPGAVSGLDATTAEVIGQPPRRSMPTTPLRSRVQGGVFRKSATTGTGQQSFVADATGGSAPPPPEPPGVDTPMFDAGDGSERIPPQRSFTVVGGSSGPKGPFFDAFERPASAETNDIIEWLAAEGHISRSTPAQIADAGGPNTYRALQEMSQYDSLVDVRSFGGKQVLNKETGTYTLEGARQRRVGDVFFEHLSGAPIATTRKSGQFFRVVGPDGYARGRYATQEAAWDAMKQRGWRQARAGEKVGDSPFGFRPDMNADEITDEIHRAIRETLKDLSPDVPPAHRTMLRKVLVGIASGLTKHARETLMFNSLTGIRGILADQIGDSWTQFTSGNLEAAFTSYDIRKAHRIYRDIRKGTVDVIARSDLGRTYDALGMSNPRQAGLAGVGVGREEVATSGKMYLNSQAQKLLRIVDEDSAKAKIVGTATGVIASERLRDFRTAWDIARRANIAELFIRKQLPVARESFYEVIRQRADDVAQADALIAKLGDEFSPADVLKYAKDAQIDAGQAEFLARTWRSTISGIERDMLGEVRRVAFDYTPTRADEVLRKIFMFHTWQLRAAPLYLRNTLRNPALASAYGHIMEDLERDAQSRGGKQSGLLKLWTSGAGYALFASPVMLLSSALINLEPDAFDDPDATLLDRVLAKVPAMANPVLRGVIYGLGYSNGAPPDILTTSHLRRPLVALLDYGRSQGWLGEERRNSLQGDVIDNFLIGLYRASYDWVADNPILTLPGSKPPDLPDPNANDNQLVQARIRDLVYEDYEVPIAITLDHLANAYPEAFDALYVALTAWETGAPNDYANQAFSDYAGGRLAASGAALLTPGGTRLRSESNDLLTLLRDVSREGGDINEEEAARASLQVSRLGSPESTQLEFGQAAVDTAGTHAQERLVDQWNEIAFGDNPASVLGGYAATNEAMRKLTDDERRDVANMWASSLPADQQALLMEARDLRAAASEKYPEDAEYRAWSNGARDMGVPAFRDQMIEGNPNYARYIEELSPEVKSDPELFDAMSISRDAYLAAIGERSQVFDAAPLPTNTGTDFYPAAAMTQATGFPASTAKDPLTKLQDDYRKYQTEVAMFNMVLQNFTGNPNASLESMNPQLRGAVEWHLAQAGISAPRKPQSIAQYEAWSALWRSMGRPTDMASYIAWREDLRSALEPSGLDVDTVIDGIMSGRVDVFAGTPLGDAIQQAAA